MFKNINNFIKKQKKQIFNEKRKDGRVDFVLLIIVVLLVVLGILILASASAHISQERFGIPYHFLKQHLLWLVIGTILAFLAFKIRLDFLKKWSPILLLINLALLAMVFVPGIGIEIWGATRWVGIGPISFQPAEFLKITFILYLASWLTVRVPFQNHTTNKIFSRGKQSFRRQLLSFWIPAKQIQKEFSQTLITFSVAIGLISLFLIFQPDISTLAIIVLTALLMYFLANTPLWHTVLIVLIGSGSLFALIKLAPYRLARLMVFLEPGIDPMGIGFHIQQALIAVGSGGILGAGLGMSIQKFGFLPGVISDSIFAIFAEETGFIGGIILISLFLIFLWRGFRISKLSQDKFSQLAAVGITSWIVIQAFVNISSMIGLLPLTGIPLPFISYGGSSLIVTLISVGILLNISKQL